MATPALKRSSRISKSCNMNWNVGAHGGGSSSSSSEECGGEKDSPHSSSRRSKKQQFFSRGLSLSNFSRSFVTLQSSITRIAHLSPHSHSQSAPSSPVCLSPRGSETSACSTPTSTSSSSSASSASSTSTTSTTPSRSHSHHHAKRPTCVVFGRRHGHSKRSKSLAGNGGAAAAHDERRPVLLEKVPSGKSGEEYITVFVGIKRTNRVKYVISRDLLSHHLFQVLLKCSEDEFGQEYATKGGIAIICDPALFLQVVKVVDDNMRESQERAELAEADEEDEDSSYDSE